MSWDKEVAATSLAVVPTNKPLNSEQNLSAGFWPIVRFPKAVSRC